MKHLKNLKCIIDSTSEEHDEPLFRKIMHIAKKVNESNGK